jgi:hypothetical protein
MRITYQQAKQSLKHHANALKQAYPNDKPAQRQGINDITDSILRDLAHPSNGMSDAKFKQAENWLINYSITLKP